MSGARRAGKTTKCGTSQVKELPLVVRVKGLWDNSLEFVISCNVAVLYHITGKQGLKYGIL